MTDNPDRTTAAWECPEWAKTFAELLAATRRGEDVEIPDLTLTIRRREVGEELTKPA